MDIPGLGTVTLDESLGWYFSEPIALKVLRGQPCRIVLDGYDDEKDKPAIHTAISNFLQAGDSVLRAAEPEIYRYYKDCAKLWKTVLIASSADVWTHVQLGDEAIVSRQKLGDHGVYVSLECECDWEPEHGLQLVFKNGLKITKVGPYDGHLT